MPNNFDFYGTGQHTLALPAESGTANFVFTEADISFCGPTPTAPQTTSACGSIGTLQSLQLPGGQAFKFEYDQGTSPTHYGELTGIDLPNGSHIQFSYANGSLDLPSLSPYALRATHADVDGASYDITYSTPAGGLFTTAQQSSGPRTICGFTTTEHSSCVTGPSHWDSKSAAYLRDDTIYSAPVQMIGLNNLASVARFSGPASGSLLMGRTDYSNYVYAGYPGLIKESKNDGSFAYTKYTYGASFGEANLNFVTQKDDFDVNATPDAAPLRSTVIKYSQSASLVNAHILDRVQSAKTYGPGGLMAETDYSYDDWPLSSSSGYRGANVAGIASHDDVNYSASVQAGRGNLTKVRRLTSAAANTWTEEDYHYNMLGQLISAVDSAGNETDYDYSDCFGPGTTPVAATRAHLRTSPVCGMA